MKPIKILLVFFILILSFIACKKTSLTITSPDSSFFLAKMQDGSYGTNEFIITNNGNKITTHGTNNYTFEKSISGIGGFYKDDLHGTNYMVVVPTGGTVQTITMGAKEKETVEEIIGIVGEENTANVILGIHNSKNDYGNGEISNIDTDKVIGNAQITEEERKKIEDLINGLGGNGNFGDYKEYKKT